MFNLESIRWTRFVDSNNSQSMLINWSQLFLPLTLFHVITASHLQGDIWLGNIHIQKYKFFDFSWKEKEMQTEGSIPVDTHMYTAEFVTIN